MAKSRLNSPWTPRDERVLRESAAKHKSAREVARTLRRSRGSVAFKAMSLGVHFSAINQPRGAQRKANRTKARRAA
jgi:hypothetical protein